MTEPTGPAEPDSSQPPAAPSQPVQPWGAYANPASVVPPAAATVAADPLRSVLAGVIAAVVGATAWALVVAVTHYEIGIAAVFVGTLVGWAMQRFGGAGSQALAITAAVLAAVGIYVGFLVGSLLQGARTIHGSIFDALDLVGNVVPWGTFLTDSVGGVGWLFLAIGAYGAWRIAGQPRRAR